MLNIFKDKDAWLDFANEHNSTASDNAKQLTGVQSFTLAAMHLAAEIPISKSVLLDIDRKSRVGRHFKGLRQLYESGIKSKPRVQNIIDECKKFAQENSIDSDDLIKKIINNTEKESWKAEQQFMNHLQANPPLIIQFATDLISWMRSTFDEPTWSSNKECNANVKIGKAVQFGLCSGRFPDDPPKNRALLSFRQTEGYEILVEKLKAISPQVDKLVSQKIDTAGFNLHLDLLKNTDELTHLKQILEEHFTMIAQQPHHELQEETSTSSSTQSDTSDITKIHAFLTARGFRINLQLLRRYHLSLKTRKFVVLSGISGTGKTWLAELYAAAIGARITVVPVAPNWTSNEDLLGYFNPLDRTYHDTDFSLFLREAAQDYAENGELAVQYHLVLDEMNLARVEYYFAKFLSLMELRSRAKSDNTYIELGNVPVLFPPNLYFIGTVNIDETTHGFADKVYDRAQLIEMVITREGVVNHIGSVPHSQALLNIWDKVHETAPFAFRVIDEIDAYISASAEAGVTWQEALDEQIVQKILPKVKGTSNRIGEILEYLILEFPEFKLTQAKSRVMLEGFRNHGFASYF